MNQLNEISEYRIAIIVFGTLVFFYIYYYFIHSDFLKNRFEKRQRNNDEIKFFLTKKITGFLILGVIPGVFYSLFINSDIDFFGFSISHFSSVFIIILILSAFIILAVYANQKSSPERNSLQIKITEWNFILFGINSFGWIIYLIGYEYLFRGILLFECNSSFGFWPAITINVVIYSAIHMVNGKDEALGALIFGAVASYFTLIQGTILIPIFMHIVLSLSSDYFSIRLNKNLSFVKLDTINLYKK